MSKEALQIGDSLVQVEELYAVGYDLYSRKHYRQACLVFHHLTSADPLEPKYWKGLGAALQMDKQYEQALHCYGCVQLLLEDQPDPYVYIYIADCYWALKRPEQSLKALEGAEMSPKGSEDQKILDHVTFMRGMWSKK